MRGYNTGNDNSYGNGHDHCCDDDNARDNGIHITTTIIIAIVIMVFARARCMAAILRCDAGE